MATASFVNASFERMRTHLNLTPCRLAILRSFVVEPVIAFLRAGAFLGGIDVNVQVTDFGNYAQQILDNASTLYSFRPDVAILAVQTRDLAPWLWEGYTHQQAPENRTAIAELTDTMAEWIRIFRERSSASLIVHNFETPAHSALGILDAQHGDGETGTVLRINQAIQRAASQYSGVYILNYDGLVSRHGREHWFDQQKWLTMRMPIAANCVAAMAEEWLRFLHPLSGRIGKVLVTDLDNTLWGGVVGDAGIEGIQVGSEYQGAPYRAMQRALLDLRSRGVLLAIASKNDHEIAIDAVRRHPGMLLRPEDFSSIQIGWGTKAESLRRIAEELNVGLNSLVFVDDNPVERQSILMELPEVTVIEVKGGTAACARSVRECPMFERLSLSAEDRSRSEYYADQRQRETLRGAVSSLEDFYNSLGQKVTIERVTKENLKRAAQLIQKTNQFNMTTHRHSEARISEFIADANYDVLTASVRDRFGDNGIVGVCIARRCGEACEIDTLLLSCRVIGRTVETAILSYLVAENRGRGLVVLEGRFLPTAKNRVSESFFPNHGFDLKERTESGSIWSLDLRTATVKCPEWIELSCPKPTLVEMSARA
ncbi:MAG: HAD-IIIC family phosphatase [Candidatus Solibacter sp.]